jgi:hypothetical protein
MIKYGYDDIVKASEILGLAMFETREAVETAYRERVKKTHPDATGRQTKEQNMKMAELNEAYNIIRNYMDNYVFSFDKQSVSRYNFDDYMMRKMRDDTTWGPK